MYSNEHHSELSHWVSPPKKCGNGLVFYRNMALSISDVPTLLQNTKKRKGLWESVLKAAQQQVHHFSSQHVSPSPNKFKALRTHKKTITIPKHLRENKLDKTNLHRFPHSNGVERTYNSQQYVPHKQPFHLGFISISVQFCTQAVRALLLPIL